MEAAYNWANLIDNPQKADGEQVCLESMISGTITEQPEPKGMRMAISPHPEKSGFNPLIDNMGIKVLVVLPGFFSPEEIEILGRTRTSSRCLTVRGKFRYGPMGNFIGGIENPEYIYD